MGKLIATVLLLYLLAVAALGAGAVVLAAERGDRLLTALNIIVSWPAVVGLVAFSAGVTFKAQIAGFVDKLALLRLPGGLEIAAQARQSPEAEPAPVEDIQA